MKILVTAEGLVDFEAPIVMTEEQKEKFIKFCKENFQNVEVVEGVREKVPNRNRVNVERKKWTIDEYLQLFSSDSNEELAKKLKRSLLSVQMMRSSFVPEVLAWAKEKGRSFPPTKEMIEEFLKERG
mgnify:CR=1 FL=1